MADRTELGGATVLLSRTELGFRTELGPFGDFGPELITNAADREFSSDTGFWTLLGGWAISGGTANGNNTSSYIFRTALGEVGLMYNINFTVVNYVSGQLTASMGGVDYTDIVNSNGVFNLVIGDGGVANGDIGLKGGTFNGSIDDISIKQIL